MRLRHMLAAAMLVAAIPRSAHACAVAGLAAPIVIPRPGATQVPTIVDLVVLDDRTPEVVLTTASGAVVPVGPAAVIGAGFDAATSSRGTVFRATPKGELAANTEHVVSVDGVERSRFTTAAGYAKKPGVAPVARGVTFTRVRYPLSELGSGNCVFSEYLGFASFDWTLGSFLDTPADSTVHVLTVAAKTGGTSESLVWFGTTPFAGSKAEGDHPAPGGFWHPYLDPTRAYCFSVAAYPYGGAVLPTRSEQVCADVAQVSAPGAAADTCASGASSGGCGIGRAGGGGVVAMGAFTIAIARRRRQRAVPR